MDERSVRLGVSDDLRRGHGSVFFRLWFALPFLLWLGLWAIAALFIAIVNWFATLAMGRSPRPFHRFFARFVRYVTHVYAYLNLGAEPLPGFDGKPGYPIDVEIAPGPSRQNRWTIGFRLVLALPPLILASVLLGFGVNPFTLTNPAVNSGAASVIGVAAFLGWFYALVRGRMPRGLRDLIAYALSFGAQLWAYLLLVSDRYPSSDPLTAIGPLPSRADPVQVENRDDLRRSRLTVFFRLLLAVPHYVWLSLWAIAALLVAIANWVSTLVLGVSPRPLHRFLAAYLRYQLHVASFVYLIGNPFPGFTGAAGSYPIELRIAARARQNRWGVFFRLLLAIPAFMLASVFGWLVAVAAFLGWFASLATGRMPLGLRNAGALALRYSAQTYAYLFLVSGAYPYSGPCVESPLPSTVPSAAVVPAPAR